MAVNDSRSQNADLLIGATEGSYKRIAMNRGGVVEEEHPLQRARDLDAGLGGYWGFQIDTTPTRPDYPA